MTSPGLSNVAALSISLLFSVIKSQSSTLQCNSNGTFKLIQFTDCHFGESAEGDSKSIASFGDLINYESPDLIAITGDFVSGYAWNHSSGWFKDHFNYGLQPILSSQIPWSYLLGNHDDQADWDRSQIIGYAASLPQSNTFVGPASAAGVSNYVLTVVDGQQEPVFNLWFLDSMDNNCYNVTGWGCVEMETVEWYRTTSIELQHKFGRKVPGIMYIVESIST